MLWNFTQDWILKIKWWISNSRNKIRWFFFIKLVRIIEFLSKKINDYFGII